MGSSSHETLLLDSSPGLRDLVASTPEFQDWRAMLPVVEIDDETFYVIGGDQLSDDDQIIVGWINQYRPHLLKGGPHHGEEERGPGGDVVV